MNEYSDSFVLSQYRYYGNNLGCGGSNGWQAVRGLYLGYTAEALRRGLIKRNPITNCYEEVCQS